MFFFLHHSLQIAARTWKELFPQALQPSVSTREAWAEALDMNQMEKIQLSLLGMSSKASIAEQLNQDYYLHVRAEWSVQ